MPVDPVEGGDHHGDIIVFDDDDASLPVVDSRLPGRVEHIAAAAIVLAHPRHFLFAERVIEHRAVEFHDGAAGELGGVHRLTIPFQR